MKTGVLGSRFAVLGDLTLGGASVLGDVVEGTPGLVLLYKCDDAAAQAAVVERFGRNATVNGTYAAGTEGVDDFALQTANATPAVSPPPYTKVTTPHATFDYTGADLSCGNSGTIEMWFRPHEFGDALRTDGGITTPQADYEFFRLENPGVSKITFRAGTLDTAGTAILRAAFSQSAWDGLDASLLFSAFANGPSTVPPCEANRWYYLVFAWDQTSTQIYTNGALAFSWGANHPPAALDGNNVHFGGCGGQYDLVSIVDHKLTAAEIASRFALGAGTTTTTEIRATNLLASYAAAYDAKGRVTQQVREVLRTGSRTARVTQQVREVLRSVSSLVVDRGSVTQTLAFTDHAYHTRVGTDSQTLTFTQTAAGDTSIPVDQTLTFTQTATHTTEHVRSLLQVLPLAQSDETGHDADLTLIQPIVFVETVSAGRLLTRDSLQVLSFSETVTDHDRVVASETVSQSLVFSETTVDEHQKRRNATDHLLFDETLVLRRVYHRAISQSLVFTESVPRPPAVRRRGVTDHLLFYEGDYPLDPSYLGTPFVTVPVARLVRVFPTVVFRSRTSAVVLPTPEWDDTEQAYNKLNVLRSMTGVFSVYVKTSQTVTLNYTFTLGRRKALEFRGFVAANLSQLVHLTNWKAEEYAGQFLTNPLSLTTTGRYAGGYEKVTVTIEFEGVRL